MLQAQTCGVNWDCERKGVGSRYPRRPGTLHRSMVRPNSRRQRLRMAIATARFAASWPTMCLFEFFNDLPGRRISH